jgi:hypothetical protein
LFGKGTGNVDTVDVYHELSPLMTNYTLVETVTFPAGGLTVVEVAVLAHSVSIFATDYSVLHHMCMWWASIFKEAATQKVRGEGGVVQRTEGPSIRAAGTAKFSGVSYTFVKDARLTIPATEQKWDTKLRRHLRQHANMADVDIEQYVDTLMADVDVWRSKADDPVAQILDLFVAKRGEVMSSIGAQQARALAKALREQVLLDEVVCIYLLKQPPLSAYATPAGCASTAEGGGYGPARPRGRPWTAERRGNRSASTATFGYG